VAPAGTANTKALGKLLYTDYVFPFEVAGVILPAGDGGRDRR